MAPCSLLGQYQRFGERLSAFAQHHTANLCVTRKDSAKMFFATVRFVPQ